MIGEMITKLFCLPLSACGIRFIHSGCFYSASSSPLLLRAWGAHDYSIDTVSLVSESMRRSATGNCELWS